jgi:nucleoid-associated protein YgaU
MHKLERYGVAALVFLLMAVLAVSLWRGSKPLPAEPLARTKTSAEPLRGRSASGHQAQEGAASRTQSLPLHRPPAGQEASLRGDQNVSDAARARQRSRSAQAEVRSNPQSPQREQLVSSDPSSVGSTATAPAAQTAQRQAASQAGPIQNTVARAEPAAARTEEARPSNYVIRAGDTLSTIAARLLGDEDRWGEIARANPDLDPKRLPVGKTIRVPAEGSLPGAAERKAEPKTVASKPASRVESAPRTGGSYTVRAGDSLSTIAASVLGDGSRWREIRDLNPGVDPSRLAVGAQLAMPRDSKAVASAKKPTETGSSDRPRVR